MSWGGVGSWTWVVLGLDGSGVGGELWRQNRAWGRAGEERGAGVGVAVVGQWVLGWLGHLHTQ